MEKIIIAAVFALISKLFERNVIQYIKDFVIKYSVEETEGYLKKLKVTEEVRNKAGVSLGQTANYLLSMAIDITHGYLKVKGIIK